MKSKRLPALLLAILLLTLHIAPCAQAVSALLLPPSVEVIKEEAFFGVQSIERIDIPYGVQEIPSRAFADSSLQEIYIPETVEKIADDAFSNCEDITIFTEPDSYAYRWCKDHSIKYVLVELDPTPSPTPDAGEVTYRALLIGNTYPGTNRELLAPDDDVWGMKTMLQLQSDTPFQITSQLNLTHNQLSNTISSRFSDADLNDVSLFYYSGHGISSSNSNSGGLLCTDDQVMSIMQLKTLLDVIPGTKIIIIDACYSGAFIGKSAVSSSTGSAKSFNDAVIAAFSAQPRSNLAQNNYIVLTACSKSEEAYEFQANFKYFGLFTYSLCKGSGADYPYLRYCPMQADQNGNQDGRTSLSEAFTYSKKIVNQQLPIQNVQYHGDPNSTLWARSAPYYPDSMPPIATTPKPTRTPAP